jgi:hypothetical protein
LSLFELSQQQTPRFLYRCLTNRKHRSDYNLPTSGVSYFNAMHFFSIKTLRKLSRFDFWMECKAQTFYFCINKQIFLCRRPCWNIFLRAFVYELVKNSYLPQNWLFRFYLFGEAHRLTHENNGNWFFLFVPNRFRDFVGKLSREVKITFFSPSSSTFLSVWT